MLNFAETYLGYNVSAKVSIKYAPGRTALKKPFIFVEGFNMIPLYNEMDFSSFFDSNWFAKDPKKSITNEYDLVYVDWNNPQADIKANALLLKDIINFINYTKRDGLGAYYKNIIVGHSMGGLIARYALTTMEHNNQTHDTAYYVSYDVPHLGVNLPVGAQFILRDLANAQSVDPIVLLFKAAANVLVPSLDSQAARQMLYHFITPQKTVSDSIHTAWQDDLFLNGFPKGDSGESIENLAISNGGSCSIADSILVYHRHQTAPDSAGIRYTTYCRVSKDPGYGTIANAKITKSVYNIFTNTFVESTLFSSVSSSPGKPVHFDLVNSSHVLVDTCINRVFNFIGKDSLETKVFPFVPEASSLATGNYYLGHYDYPPSPLKTTPFNAFFLYNYRQDHSLFYDKAWSGIMDQINMSIAAPSIVETGDVLQMYNDTTGFTSHLWESSDTTVATIHPASGQVTVVRPGMVTFSCTINGDRGPLRCCHHKQKKVMAGFPDIILSMSGGQGSYLIEAELVDAALNQTVDSLVACGTLSYQWGVKVGNASIAWEAPSDDDSYYISTQGNDPVSVFCRFHSNSGTGQYVSIPVVVPHYLYFDYDPLSITAYIRGPVMNYQIFGSYPPYPSYVPAQQLAVKIKSNYLSAGIPAPYSIVIGPSEVMYVNNTLQVEEADGFTYTVYCFNLSESSYLDSVIDSVLQTPGQGEGEYFTSTRLLPIYIRSQDEEVLQVIGIPVSAGTFAPFPPLN